MNFGNQEGGGGVRNKEEEEEEKVRCERKSSGFDIH